MWLKKPVEHCVRLELQLNTDKSLLSSTSKRKSDMWQLQHHTTKWSLFMSKTEITFIALTKFLLQAKQSARFKGTSLPLCMLRFYHLKMGLWTGHRHTLHPVSQVTVCLSAYLNRTSQTVHTDLAMWTHCDPSASSIYRLLHFLFEEKKNTKLIFIKTLGTKMLFYPLTASIFPATSSSLFQCTCVVFHLLCWCCLIYIYFFF